MNSEKKVATSEQRDRILQALEELLEIAPSDTPTAMEQAAQCVSELTRSDKVDVFLLEPSTQSLVAVGTSDSPLARRQKALGLDRLLLANAGRTVEVFRTGKTWFHAHQDEDPGELTGLKEGLAIRSHLSVLLEVGGERRGVLDAQSCTPDFFTAADVGLLESAARWVGMVIHRVELGEALAKASVEQGRRSAAEELITLLAHHLGNLISPIRIRLELILRRATREGAAEHLRDAEAASQSLQELSQLMADLLDMGRLEQGLFNLTLLPTDLVALAEEVARLATTPGKQVQLTGVPELVVQADTARIRQALEHLVANARQHSPAGLPVLLDVQVEQRADGAWARVSVKDQGVGIPPDVVPRIFQRVTERPGSTVSGLGLYLVRGIVEAHRGELQVRSQPGKGTTFVLGLPVTRK